MEHLPVRTDADRLDAFRGQLTPKGAPPPHWTQSTRVLSTPRELWAPFAWRDQLWVTDGGCVIRLDLAALVRPYPSKAWWLVVNDARVSELAPRAREFTGVATDVRHTLDELSKDASLQRPLHTGGFLRRFDRLFKAHPAHMIQGFGRLTPASCWDAKGDLVALVMPSRDCNADRHINAKGEPYTE